LGQGERQYAQDARENVRRRTRVHFEGHLIRIYHGASSIVVDDGLPGRSATMRTEHKSFSSNAGQKGSWRSTSKIAVLAAATGKLQVKEGGDETGFSPRRIHWVDFGWPIPDARTVPHWSPTADPVTSAVPGPRNAPRAGGQFLRCETPRKNHQGSSLRQRRGGALGRSPFFFLRVL